jgi:pimeloyl-ACP methyl ester carboxylesterase
VSVQFLERTDGRLAYEVTGEGPLVLCSPGLGDLRTTFSALVEPLVAAGFRVAITDLRGHGESSTGWPSYQEAEVAGDLLALAAELSDQPAILLGNSYSAGAAVVAAARAPESVAGLVLTGPFVRDRETSATDKLTMWLVSLPWLGRRLWVGYWPKLFGQHKPADLAARRKALASNLAEPGRFAAVNAMVRADHADAQRALPDVRCPSLVVMGEQDPDFPDPAAEAAIVARSLGGPSTVWMVPEAGHYPHAELPASVAASVADFIRTLDV